jgi:hypothetical protein
MFLPRREVKLGMLAIQLLDGLEDPQPCADCPLSVVAVRDRRAEHRDRAVNSTRSTNRGGGAVRTNCEPQFWQNRAVSEFCSPQVGHRTTGRVYPGSLGRASLFATDGTSGQRGAQASSVSFREPTLATRAFPNGGGRGSSGSG